MIKHHLDVRNFLGSNDNAIRLQILTAMIAYLLLRIAARANHITMLHQARRTRPPVPLYTAAYRHDRQTPTHRS